MIMPTVLEKIIRRKQEEVAQRKRDVSIETLRPRALDQPPTRGFSQALINKCNQREPAIIAEIKKASPSQGVIRPAFNPIEIAESYEQHGATCLSVLTDIDFFQGADHYLTAARNAVNIPVIRKDFIIDEYQVHEARAIGADAILLIVAAIESDDHLGDLNALAHELGMDVLVEVHSQEELARALPLPNPLLGINNRNLHNFVTSLQVTLDLAKEIGDDKVIITESGISTPLHVKTMIDEGIYGFLIGEAFMRADQPGVALDALFSEQAIGV